MEPIEEEVMSSMFNEVCVYPTQADYNSSIGSIRKSGIWKIWRIRPFCPVCLGLDELDTSVNKIEGHAKGHTVDINGMLVCHSRLERGARPSRTPTQFQICSTRGGASTSRPSNFEAVSASTSIPCVAAPSPIPADSPGHVGRNFTLSPIPSPIG